jgi:hypothetical protein
MPATTPMPAPMEPLFLVLENVLGVGREGRRHVLPEERAAACDLERSYADGGRLESRYESVQHGLHLEGWSFLTEGQICVLHIRTAVAASTYSHSLEPMDVSEGVSSGGTTYGTSTPTFALFSTVIAYTMVSMRCAKSLISTYSSYQGALHGDGCQWLGEDRFSGRQGSWAMELHKVIIVPIGHTGSRKSRPERSKLPDRTCHLHVHAAHSCACLCFRQLAFLPGAMRVHVARGYVL